jgi:X-Pro dipeptidyl-peptidase
MTEALKSLCRLLVLALAVALPAAAAPQEGKTLPVFRDGEAQVVEGFRNRADWIRHDLWVETPFDSDGDGKPDRMHVSVTRQKQTDTEGLRVPVVYESSPYYSGTGGDSKAYFWNPRQELGAAPPKRTNAPPIKPQARRPVISDTQIGTWVPRGYAVVHSESPGTGLSQGCPTVGADNESLAPKAVIDWLNGRAAGYTAAVGGEPVKAFWSTGKVGMTGTSYNGTLCLAAATTGVEGLEAIIPIAPNTSYYHYYRSHGLIRHPGGYMGEDIDVLYEFIDSGDPERRGHCDQTVRDEVMLKKFDRIKGDYNEFWAGRDYIHKLGPVKAATLMAHAFNDWNVMPEHSVRIYEALKKKGIPLQAYFHQGGHGGEPPIKLMNRWFTRYLHGIENGVEKDPRSWIVREDADRKDPVPYADYPHPDAVMIPLHLNAGGGSAGPLTQTSKDGQGQEKLIDDVSFSGADLAKAESSKHRLLFATPALTRPLHVSGAPRLKIRLASSKPAANLSVWLVSLPWTEKAKITTNIITRGWADPQNHRSLTESEPLEPGRFYEMSFALQPDDQVIPAGRSIGLMIFSSDRDFTLWPEAGTELTVDLDRTVLELPVVGGARTLREAMGKTTPNPVRATPVDIIPLTAEAALPYKLDTGFYKKCATVQDILITSSNKVPDVAYLETAYLFDRIMKSIAPAVAQRIRDQKVVCILIGRDELTSELPQFSSDKKGKELDFYNWRNRGFLTRKEGHPTFLFSEEDVLEYEGGMQNESILIHEFGHVIDGAGFDKELKDRLTQAYKNAKEKGLWNDGYAAQRFRRVNSQEPVSLHDALLKSFPSRSTELLRKCLDGGDILVNGKPTHSKIMVTREDKVLIVFGGPKPCYATVSRAEYWAEGLQSWYDTNRTMDHDHNHIHTREQLKGYDPELAKLCEEVLGDSPWRFVSPRRRAGAEHLKDYDPMSAPKMVKLDHLEAAAQDYYDGYWKSYWKRLYDKHGLSEGPQ